MNKSNFFPHCLSSFLHSKLGLYCSSLHNASHKLHRTVPVTFLGLRADLDCCMATEILRSYIVVVAALQAVVLTAFLCTLSLTPVCDAQKIGIFCTSHIGVRVQEQSMLLLLILIISGMRIFHFIIPVLMLHCR